MGMFAPIRGRRCSYLDGRHVLLVFLRYSAGSRKNTRNCFRKLEYAFAYVSPGSDVNINGIWLADHAS